MRVLVPIPRVGTGLVTRSGQSQVVAVAGSQVEDWWMGLQICVPGCLVFESEQPEHSFKIGSHTHLAAEMQHVVKETCVEAEAHR